MLRYKEEKIALVSKERTIEPVRSCSTARSCVSSILKRSNAPFCVQPLKTNMADMAIHEKRIVILLDRISGIIRQLPLTDFYSENE
ncbi:MAG: hypothetical protein A2023_04560 [Sulfuricurvum sp. GWF2_44_89]|uniref:Uncharacterized protein n=1 Tax=Sulfuricurvum kujiense TaxID=148813 RepID=A0A2D3WFB7_9BACT|nr:MAG: hypothetical protein A2023_04560 [Sulfuricurvum sp. GWF2_44_89]OHD92691.1 MAG: hypothetical protein A2552_08260 [Sulfuricurvum sp. RIFOXYD2_FULL_44_160]OHD96131.1 MAG: hypothetical protein A2517_07790 [Sulfuricurvum sp. RIFOXYD12_FULL_44_77]DAB37437.1 MAG TPA: hypothetical protein CFH83_10975 [Sulfuricurvum kujiense]